MCRKSSVAAAARLTKPSERIFFQFLFKGKQSQEDACLSVCLHFQLRNEPVVGVSCCSCRCLPYPQLSNHKGPITKWEAHSNFANMQMKRPPNEWVSERAKLGITKLELGIQTLPELVRPGTSASCGHNKTTKCYSARPETSKTKGEAKKDKWKHFHPFLCPCWKEVEECSSKHDRCTRSALETWELSGTETQGKGKYEHCFHAHSFWLKKEWGLR